MMSPKDQVNILMVDDQPGKLLSYEVILGELDENLIKATSAREALEILLKTEVAVVLLDVSMPEINGFELAEMIREHPRFQTTAILFISAVHLTDLDRLKGYQRGAVDYISVPVNPELLRAKVSIFAELHRKTRQLERLNRELEQRVAERTLELQRAHDELDMRVTTRTAELRIAEENLRHLSGRLMRSQDEERRRIARDLHDGLGQYLVAVKMSLDVLAMTTANDPKLVECLDDATKQIETAIAETRTMSHLLHPPLLDEIGLESAIVWYAEGFAKRSGISVDVSISPALGRLETETETALFRVVQECLTNIHRHSDSATAKVRLAREQGEIKLEVGDEGKGISSNGDDSTQLATPGIGLQGIRERVRQLRGNVEIGANGGKGTVVRVSIPDSTSAKSSDVPRDSVGTIAVGTRQG